jgi:flagellar biosynthesis GTPase FlhF
MALTELMQFAVTLVFKSKVIRVGIAHSNHLRLCSIRTTSLIKNMTQHNKYSLKEITFKLIGGVFLISAALFSCSRPDPIVIISTSPEPSRSAQPIATPSSTDNSTNSSVDVEKAKREAEQAKAEAEQAKQQAAQAKAQADSESEARRQAEQKLKEDADAKKREADNASTNAKAILNSNESMARGESRVSRNGCYRLIFQDDGNLVVYNKSKALWGAGTENKAIESLKMQSDGNLVMYGYNKKPVWASNTLGNDGARLEIQDDGNVVIYAPSSNRPVWETRTYGNGCG